MIEFNYLARGPNLGTLVLSSKQQGSSDVKVEWLFDGIETSGWTTENVEIRSATPISFTVSSELLG